jgi:hypothetical protein
MQQGPGLGMNTIQNAQRFIFTSCLQEDCVEEVVPLFVVSF